MKKILLFILFIISAYIAECQTFNYNPSLNQTQNLPSAPAQGFALDARSYVYDSINYTYRPYTGTAEVLTYLSNHKYRYGNFPIIVNSGGTLSGGLITGGVNTAYWFQNGLNDSNLVVMIPPSTSCTGCLINTNNLSDVSNAAAARTNLGLQNMAQQTTAAGGDLSGFWPSPTVAQFNGLPPSYYLNYNNLTNKPTIPAQFNPIAGSNMALSGTYPNIQFSVTGLPNTAGVYIKLTSGGNVISLDTANYRKVDTLYGVNDSTLAYTLNGNLYTVQLRGGTHGGGGGGSGTVTSVSVVSANGISGTVSNPTSAAAITLLLGAITPTSVNGLTLAALTSGFSISGGTTSYTLTVDSTATIKGNNSGDVTLSGQNYLTISGQAITANAVNVSGSNITGVLKAASFPALTGQVTTSAGSLATTIATNTVTYSNLQQLPAYSLFGNPTNSLANSQATYVGYGMLFNADTIKVDTSTLKSHFAWGGLTSVTATGGNPVFSTTTAWSAQTVGLTFSLLNASAYNILGNNTSSSGIPAYFEPNSTILNTWFGGTIQAALTFNNGLSSSGTTAQLGGNPLIQNTTIEGGLYNLILDSLGYFQARAINLSNGVIGKLFVGSGGGTVLETSAGNNDTSASIETIKGSGNYEAVMQIGFVSIAAPDYPQVLLQSSDSSTNIQGSYVRIKTDTTLASGGLFMSELPYTASTSNMTAIGWNKVTGKLYSIPLSSGGGGGTDTIIIGNLGHGLVTLRGSTDTLYSKTDSAGYGIAKAYSPDSAIVTSATNVIDTTIIGIRALTSASSSTLYYTKDAGQQGFWKYDSTDVSSSDNTGTILVAGTLRFKRVFSGAVNVQWFGAKDDNSTDDQAAINKAIAYAVPLNMDIYFPVVSTGIYKILTFPGTSNNVIFDLPTGSSGSPYRVRFYGDKGATITSALDSNTATYTGMRLFRVNGAYNDLTFDNLVFINTHPLASSANYTGCLMLTGGTNSQLIKHPIIKNCFFNGWSNDIETDGVDDIEIYGNKFISPLGHDNATNSTTPAPYIWMFCNSNGLTRNPDIHDNYAYAYTGTDITTTTTRAVFDNFVYGNPIGGKVHHNFIFNFGTEAISLSQYNSTSFVTTPTEISDNYIDGTIIKNSWNIGGSTLATSSTSIRTQSLNPVVKNNTIHNATNGISIYQQSVYNYPYAWGIISGNTIDAADSGQGVFSVAILVSGYGSGTSNHNQEIAYNTVNFKNDSLKANAHVFEIDYADSSYLHDNVTNFYNLTTQGYTLNWLQQQAAFNTYIRNNQTIPNNNGVYNALYLNSGSSTIINLDSIPNFAVTEVDTIYRTAGKDSIQFTIGGRYHAILDSIGSGGGSSLPFADNTALLKNNSDNTKTLTFNLSQLTTSTNVVDTLPKYSANVMLWSKSLAGGTGFSDSIPRQWLGVRKIFNVVTDYHADSTGATDATAAIQNALNDAAASGYSSTVRIPNGTYLISGPIITTNSCNCQIQLPYSSTYNHVVNITIEGDAPANSGSWIASPFTTTYFTNGGAILKSTYAGTQSTTLGQIAVIGSGGSPNYNTFTISNITTVTKNNPNGYGPEIGGISGKNVIALNLYNDVYLLDTAPIAYVLPQRNIAAFETPDNDYGSEYILHNDSYSGTKMGLYGGEHIDGYGIMASMNYSAFTAKPGYHSSHIVRFGDYWNYTGVSYGPAMTSGSIPLTFNIDQYDIERGSGNTGNLAWLNRGYDINDSLNLFHGTINFSSVTQAVGQNDLPFNKNGGATVSAPPIRTPFFYINPAGTIATIPNGNKIILGTPDSSAWLQLQHNTSTNAQIWFQPYYVDPSSPKNGQMWYDSLTPALYFRNANTNYNLLNLPHSLYGTLGVTQIPWAAGTNVLSSGSFFTMDTVNKETTLTGLYPGHTANVNVSTGQGFFALAASGTNKWAVLTNYADIANQWDFAIYDYANNKAVMYVNTSHDVSLGQNAYNAPAMKLLNAGGNVSYANLYPSATNTYSSGTSSAVWTTTYSQNFNSSATQSAVSGSSSGTATFSEPFQGTSYKKVIVYCAALNGTAAYVFPVAFTNAPSVTFATSGISASVGPSTTGVTLSASTVTGVVIIEGY